MAACYSFHAVRVLLRERLTGNQAEKTSEYLRFVAMNSFSSLTWNFRTSFSRKTASGKFSRKVMPASPRYQFQRRPTCSRLGIPHSCLHIRRKNPLPLCPARSSIPLPECSTRIPHVAS